MHWISDGVGWETTAFLPFLIFGDDSRKFRWVQAAEATVSACRGALIHSLPAIVANLTVLTAALATARLRRGWKAT